VFSNSRCDNVFFFFFFFIFLCLFLFFLFLIFFVLGCIFGGGGGEVVLTLKRLSGGILNGSYWLRIGPEGSLE